MPLCCVRMRTLLNCLSGLAKRSLHPCSAGASSPSSQLIQASAVRVADQLLVFSSLLSVELRLNFVDDVKRQ